MPTDQAPPTQPIAVVTGASGFIAPHVAEALAGAGYRVRRLVRGSRTTRGDLPAGTRVVDYASVRSLADAVRDAQLVIHLAGVTKALDLPAFRAGNVEPTRALLEAVGEAPGVQRFVHVSSLAAVGPPAAGQAVTEDHEPRPIDAYGRSKLEAERLVASESPVEWTIVRPAAVYGPGDRDFGAVFRQVQMGVVVHAPSGARRLSIAHVRDVAAGIVAAATTARAAHRAYFLAREDVTWADVYDAAAAASGATIRFAFDAPRVLITAAALVGDAIGRATGTVPLVNSQKATMAGPWDWVCSSARARDELGFNPSISLREGMRASWPWYRDAR